jgi:hypothetical protein
MAFATQRRKISEEPDPYGMRALLHETTSAKEPAATGRGFLISHRSGAYDSPVYSHSKLGSLYASSGMMLVRPRLLSSSS